MAVDVRNADGEVVEEGKGGGIYSTGQVSLRRSTVSGNLAEHFGGAFYSTPGPTKTKALIDVDVSTVAGNAAGPIPEQWVVRITDSGLSPGALPGPGRTVRSGDEIRFEDQTGQSHAMTVKQPLPAGVSCTEGPVQVPLIGMGLSTPLVCSIDASVAVTIATVTVTELSRPEMQLALTLTRTTSRAARRSTRSATARPSSTASIVHTAGAVENCGRPAGDALAWVTSKGTNVMRPEAVDGRAGESSCVETDGDILEDPLLGPLQDNNQIDYDAKTVSGYTENHALLPGSPAIDALGDSNCLAGVVHDIDAASPVSLTLPAGAIVGWTSATTATVGSTTASITRGWCSQAPMRVGSRCSSPSRGRRSTGSTTEPAAWRRVGA